MDLDYHQTTTHRRTREAQTVHVDVHEETAVGVYEDEASGQEVKMLFGSDEQGFHQVAWTQRTAIANEEIGHTENHWWEETIKFVNSEQVCVDRVQRASCQDGNEDGKVSQRSYQTVLKII